MGMVSLDLWLLDVTTERQGGREVVCLWMLDGEGRRYALLDPTHRDWAYLVGPGEALDKAESAIRGGYGGRVEVRRVRRLLSGREVEALQVVSDPRLIEDVIRLAKGVARGIEVYEEDIRFSNKYLLSRDLSPSSWYRVECELGGGERVRRGVLKSLSPAPRAEYPPMRVASLDLVLASPLGEPDPASDPVLAATLCLDGGVRQYVAGGGDDRSVVESLLRDIESHDPHVIVTFGGNEHIWPYLVERCRAVGRELRVGLGGEEPHQSLFGHFSIPGRLNIDVKGYVDNSPVFQRKTLEELAAYVGIGEPERSFDRLAYYEVWRRDRDALLEYSRWRARAIYDAFQELKEEIFSLSSITGMPADYVLSASTGHQVENYIMRSAVKRGHLIPKAVQRRRGTYAGGLVLAPKPGLHRDVCVIDFKSMYPTLMMKYNVSPDTVTTSPGEGVEFFGEIGVGVRRDVEGLFPAIIKRLVEERDAVRERMRGLDPSSPEYRVLDAYQRVLKVLANAMYGYMGWSGARYYSLEGAQLVTYLGRETITRSREKAEELGLKVLYGDTDSLFVNYDRGRVEKLLDWVSSELGLEAKIDRVYRVLLFTEAKKRYAGLTEDGRIEIVGLEYVRRDWCDYARETQYGLVKLVLQGAPREKILDYFRERVRRLSRGEVPIEQVVIWEQVTKRLGEYKAMSPHLAVAEELAMKGWKIRRGTFIGYVILKGSGPLYKRAAHYTMAKKDDIDWDYYVQKQLIPAAARVLEPIGISKSDLESIASGLYFSIDRFLG